MISEFGKWIVETYDKVSVSEVASLGLYFAERGLFDEYCQYAKSDYNHVFGDIEWIEEEVLAIHIAKKLSGEAREVLDQVVESPKFDGDVVSKTGKSELYSHGLVLRIANGGEFGDNAANSLGYKVWKATKTQD